MTPAERRRRFIANVRAQARRRGVQVDQGVADMLGTLVEMRTEIQRILENTPSDFQAHQLPQLLAEVDRQIEHWRDRAVGLVERLVHGAWELGPDILDGPLAAVRIHVGRTILPRSLLEELSSYTAGKIKDIGPVTRKRIEHDIRLAALGGQSPHEAMKAVSEALGRDGLRYIDFRSETIVRTELGRVQSASGHLRMVDAAKIVTDLGKEWLWSGKSRVQHAAINGQRRKVSEDYEMPDGTKMPYPRAAGAPVGHVANCGCQSVPYKAGW